MPRDRPAYRETPPECRPRTSRPNGTGGDVVTLDRAEEVLAVAEEIEAKEEAILAAVRGVIPLGEARQKHGYHALQTRGA